MQMQPLIQLIQPTTINNFTKSEEPTYINKEYPINLNNSEFMDTINYLVDNYNFDEIIETGTYNGLGSTTIFAKTKKYVFTIECNKDNYEIARKNLEQYQNVCVIHGLSIDRLSLINFLLYEDFTLDTKYDSDFPKSFYMKEISQNVIVENALEIFCNNDRKQLVFLDSAGGVGWAEYSTFIDEFLNDNKILVLDDISHIKHKRSVEDLESRGYIVNKSKENRFAWCDLSKGKLLKNGKENILSE